MMRNIPENDPTAAPGFSYLASDRFWPKADLRFSGFEAFLTSAFRKSGH